MDGNETKKLFYEDSYTKEFEAEVLSCKEIEDGYAVVLDQTAFFPEGGGQYADTGVLNDIPVYDVQEEDGIIIHYTKGPLKAGSKVTGSIHWEERFDKMQQHTGEHIVSGLVHGRFGYNNVGFHLADTYCTMDFDGPITPQELTEIEEAANQAVWDNLTLKVLYPTKEEAKEMTYRSKIEIEGQIRIVVIPGVDVCACCAPHVRQTGEVGLIKLVDRTNYKGGERITMLCGRRALSDYQEKAASAKEISGMLCAKESEISEAVARLKEEQGESKGKVVELSRKLLDYQAMAIPISEDVTAVFDDTLTGNDPRELMNRLLERGAKICAVFAGSDADGYRYVIGSKTEDVRDLGKQLNEAFSGRGGGKPQMIQGSLKGTENEIRRMLK